MEIDLSRGMKAVVDDADAAIVAPYNWFVVDGGRTMYARAYEKDADGRKLKPISMHGLILGTRHGKVIDHKDGDGLNNRRANLRHCSTPENVRNQRAQEGCKSPFKGVLVCPGRAGGARFVAQIQQAKERLKIGSYESEHAAARAYDAAARLFHGAFARTNKDMGLFDLYPDRTTKDFPKRRRVKRVRY